MTVVWIDPINTDPMFLNALGHALATQGHRVVVRSQARRGFEPPESIEWSSFGPATYLPQTLEGRKFKRLAVGITYPIDWLRAVRFAKQCNVKSVLVSTNLALPRIDAWGMRLLRRYGLTPVAIVHKPYRKFFEDHGHQRAEDSRAYYNEAARILVMNHYTQDALIELYSLPEHRFVHFLHLHFSDLLANIFPSEPLLSSLRTWASSAPVVSFLSAATTEHDLQTFLSSLPLLRKIVPGVRVLIVSRVSNLTTRRLMARRLEEAGLAERCLHRCEPYSFPELLAYLAVTSVVAVPYRYATQSAIIALAAGRGIPVVATKVGGLPEMVVPGKTGELIPPGDPSALAHAISRVVAPEVCHSYREGAREFARTRLSPATAAAVVSRSLLEVTKTGT